MSPRYLGVLSAIKTYQSLIDIELSVKPVITPHNYEIKVLSGKTINLSKCRSKTFYFEFINFRLKPPTSLFRWSEKHNIDESLFYNSLPLVKNVQKSLSSWQHNLKQFIISQIVLLIYVHGK